MKLLSLVDIQNIVNAVLKESEINEDFKSLVLNDVEEAICLIVERDFPIEVKERYKQTLKNYGKMT